MRPIGRRQSSRAPRGQSVCQGVSPAQGSTVLAPLALSVERAGEQCAHLLDGHAPFEPPPPCLMVCPMWAQRVLRDHPAIHHLMACVGRGDLPEPNKLTPSPNHLRVVQRVHHARSYWVRRAPAIRILMTGIAVREVLICDNRPVAPLVGAAVPVLDHGSHATLFWCLR